MKKFGYTLLTAISFLAFNSCSNQYLHTSTTSSVPSTIIPSNSYGNYLAGRIAHYRQDFGAAAEYYMKTAAKDPQNVSLLNRTYLMLASQGRIQEAAHYAKLSSSHKDNNDFIAIIVASDNIKQNDYKEALKTIQSNKSALYQKLITPFVKAWSHTGLNQYQQAISALDTLKKEPGMISLYHFHSGMINDYFDKPEKAKFHYESIINDKSMELSVRTLEIICNFYIRNGEKDKAISLASQYSNTIPPVVILKKISDNVKNADSQHTNPIITSPQYGISEAFFNIAAIIKHNSEILDFSHIFIRLALYENPRNDLARILLANILEMREMYKDAITIYDEVPESSPAYYIAQYKKAENLRNLNDYKGSELLLKGLILDYPNDYQLLIDLGDTLRMQEKYKESTKYYNKVLEEYKSLAGGMWHIHYALGMTYERMGKWEEAEQNLLKALEINPNNLLVQNYLGYSWIKQGKNPEQAFQYIASAYNQAPYNSSIIDSLGWALYNFGLYEQAITYLEKAADTDPSNAVINDHLGDAYWQGGRKNEARFQWNHALSLKDDSGEVIPEVLKRKLSKGLEDNNILPHDKTKINETIAKINDNSSNSNNIKITAKK